MRIRYARAAWRDITQSPGWFSKLAILALVSFIPVFGQVVVLGYLFGWAREAAWNIHAPLPEHIFADSDGKLYRRGFFALVIVFVFALVPGVVDSLAQAAGATAAIPADLGASSAFAASAGQVGAAEPGALGALLTVAAIAIACVTTPMSWVGIMRMSIYNRLSAGFQLKRIAAMVKHEPRGILRILVLGIAMNLVAAIVGMAIVAVCALAGFVGVGGMLGAAFGDGTGLLLYGMSALSLLVSLAFLVAGTLVGVWIAVLGQAMVARALGLWTSQFDVSQWRGQDDPMPFERFAH